METKEIAFKDPWGFSKLDVFRACPAKFKYQFLDKLPQGSSPAMERGGKMHENIESYLNGWTSMLLPELVTWRPAFDDLKTKAFRGEQSIGIDDKWVMLKNWFEKATWLRVKMDAYYIADHTMRVIDFKSGKYREPSRDQIEIYAIAGLSIEPTIEEVVAEFWFLDTGDIFTRKYSSKELLDLRLKYEQGSNRMYMERLWDPVPSSACRYCPYSKTKEGPCKY